FSNGLTFDNIENLTGGDADDTFVFSDGASLEGIIDGATGFDILDYFAYTTAVDVDLAANTATGTSGVFNIEDVILPPQDIPVKVLLQNPPVTSLIQNPPVNLVLQDPPVILLIQNPPVKSLIQNSPTIVSSPDLDPPANDQEDAPPQEDVPEKLPLSCYLSVVDLDLEGLSRGDEAIATGGSSPLLKVSDRIVLQSLTEANLVEMGNQSVYTEFGDNQQKLFVRFDQHCNLVSGS
ncbi:MAG: hypothetical protein F6K41_31350, partial [Symploca sp. SIO3E6]|nr:hypothetical protein [Caldora sp. SIO3E6]